VTKDRLKRKREGGKIEKEIKDKRKQKRGGREK
jgi:hypothetical protein